MIKHSPRILASEKKATTTTRVCWLYCVIHAVHEGTGNQTGCKAVLLSLRFVGCTVLSMLSMKVQEIRVVVKLFCCTRACWLYCVIHAVHEGTGNQTGCKAVLLH